MFQEGFVPGGLSRGGLLSAGLSRSATLARRALARRAFMGRTFVRRAFNTAVGVEIQKGGTGEGTSKVLHHCRLKIPRHDLGSEGIQTPERWH